MLKQNPLAQLNDERTLFINSKKTSTFNYMVIKEFLDLLQYIHQAHTEYANIFADHYQIFTDSSYNLWF